MSSILVRLYDFIAGDRIRSAEVDAEFDQLVAGHNEIVNDLAGTTGADTGASNIGALDTYATVLMTCSHSLQRVRLMLIRGMSRM